MSGFEETNQPEQKAGAVMEEDPPGEASVSLRQEEDEEADFITPEDVEAEFQVGEVDDANVMVDDEEHDEGERVDGVEDDEEEEEPTPVVEDMAKVTFKGHSDAVYCVAVNPKVPSQFVSGGGDDKGFLWAISDNGTVTGSYELGGHTDTVSSVGFSSDGTLVATGCYGGLVKVWEAATAKSKHQLEGPEDVECLAWHTSGRVLLTGSQDGTVWMWDASAGSCMQVFAGHVSKVSCVAFTSSGKAVVSGSDDATVRVWAPRTGECKHTFEGHGFHEGAVTCLASFSTASMCETVKCCIMRNLREFGMQELTDVIRSLADGETVGPGGIPFEMIKIAPNGYLALRLRLVDIVAPLIVSGGEDGTARVMHVQNKRVLGTLVHCAEGEGSVEAVGFCATHPWVATGGTDGALKIWDSVSGACRHTCAHPGAVTKLEWHPSAPVVFTACVDGNLRAWDARTGECSSVLTGHTDMILDMRLVDLRPREDAPATVPAPTGGGAEFPVLIVSASDDKTCKLFRWPPGH